MKPTIYTNELAEDICHKLMEGKSLRAICSDDIMPDKSTVLRWVQKNPEFEEMYTYARKIQVEVMFDEILYHSDTPLVGAKKIRKPDGREETVVSDNVERSKLMTENRKWWLARMDRNRFGDHLKNEHSGSVSMKVSVVGGLPDEE